MYHVSVQGVDERMINVHYWYVLISLKGIKKQNKKGAQSVTMSTSVHYKIRTEKSISYEV